MDLGGKVLVGKDGLERSVAFIHKFALPRLQLFRRRFWFEGFRRQLEHGGPITVTHPEVTRYFMTIPEAAQLILQAGGLGEGGEIFILKMGTPVKISQMAEELIRLSGKTPGKDVEIVFTGLREGEKLFEELITQDEGVVNTRYEKIMVLRAMSWNGKKNQEPRRISPRDAGGCLTE